RCPCRRSRRVARAWRCEGIVAVRHACHGRVARYTMLEMPETRVVTLGGGHGQAALLTALTELRCEITAFVNVADDGGCSGKLRRELGMPPPGDIRRCLTALARDRRLAERFEVRLKGDDRSAGNLALSEAYAEL